MRARTPLLVLAALAALAMPRAARAIGIEDVVDGGNTYPWVRVELPGTVCSNGSQGCNIHYVGAIRNSSVSPDSFTKCLPTADWEAIYIWDGPNQQWQHYFNTTKTPAYVNDTNAGGISTIPGFSGVVLIMRLGSASQSVTLLDANSETCS